MCSKASGARYLDFDHEVSFSVFYYTGKYECVVDAGHVSGKISDLYRISLTGLFIFSAFGKLK